MKNFSLAIFVFFLTIISYSTSVLNNVKFECGIKHNKVLLKSKLKRISSQIKNNFKAVSKNFPTYQNKGFKCAPLTHKEVSSKYCSEYGENCISSGIIMFGPDDNGLYEFLVTKQDEKVFCSHQTFKLKEFKLNKQKCFTQFISKSELIKNNKEISELNFTNRLCRKGRDETDGKLLLLLQNKKMKCDKETFSVTVKDNISGDCECHEISLPSESEGTQKGLFINYHIATRITQINPELQCLTSDNKTCTLYNDKESCFNDINKDKLSKIKAVELNDKTTRIFSHSFYFNRWICPSESGLQVAIQFEKEDNSKSYKIKCLGKTDIDCLYDFNAEFACRQINQCKQSSDNYSSLVCGSQKYKANLIIMDLKHQ